MRQEVYDLIQELRDNADKKRYTLHWGSTGQASQFGRFIAYDTCLRMLSKEFGFEYKDPQATR